VLQLSSQLRFACTGSSLVCVCSALREGATENAEAAKDLRQHLVAQGVNPARRHLFVVDASKALRTAINAVFGSETPVQQCRNHKLRNVLKRLPREQQAQTASRCARLER
jgi:putative transposase